VSIATSAPTAFDSFNARALEPAQVARTFVPPRQYSELVKHTHTLIVGPRGSGKTTLLKMLQAPALEAWSHQLASEFRQRVNFTGVFVPTDVSWSAQLDALGGGRLSPEHQRIISMATFTTHVLRQLIAALHYRVHAPNDPALTPHRRVELTASQEATVVAEIAREWMIEPAVPSLSALRRALTGRLSGIRALASAEALTDSSLRSERFAGIGYLHLQFREASAVAIEVFDEMAGEIHGKWALLFDELELAPQWIREDLMRSLRSSDDRFLFKLSTSPYTEDVRVFDQPQGAMAGHDFESIPLWYAHREEGFPFCRALLESMIKEYGIPEVDATRLFGRSEFETEQAEWTPSGTAYSPGSRLHARFLRLAAKDKSFRDYLAAKGIDPHRMHELKGDERAAEVRKVTSLVAVRDAFRGPDGQGQNPVRARSRKNPDLYRGAASLFAIVEGNPRWFIGIVGTLLREQYYPGLPISAGAQVSEVVKAANRFRALLRTIPSRAVSTDAQPRGLLSVLDPIGRFFFKAVVVDDFNPDPPGSFTVDAESGPLLTESLGRALNAGAIVYVPDQDSQTVLGALRGKRFRLSYLLAVHYRIPIRLGREVSLSRILAGGGSGQGLLAFDEGGSDE
jgi:hypothetical protein